MLILSLFRIPPYICNRSLGSPTFPVRLILYFPTRSSFPKYTFIMPFSPLYLWHSTVLSLAFWSLHCSPRWALWFNQPTHSLIPTQDTSFLNSPTFVFSPLLTCAGIFVNRLRFLWEHRWLCAHYCFLHRTSCLPALPSNPAPLIYDSQKWMSLSRITFDDLTLSNSCGVIFKLNCGDKILLLKKSEISKRINFWGKKQHTFLFCLLKKFIEILDFKPKFLCWL